MTRFIIFIFILAPLWITAGNTLNDPIPTIEGKIVFHKTYDSNLSELELNDLIHQFLNEKLNPYSGIFTIDNEDFTVCRITDYILVESNFLQTFAMYMTYSLSVEYQSDGIQVHLQNIQFMEKEYFEAKEEAKTFRTRELNMPEYSGEDIMLHGYYKLLMVRKASQKVTQAALQRINQIFEDIEILLLRH